MRRCRHQAQAAPVPGRQCRPPDGADDFAICNPRPRLGVKPKLQAQPQRPLADRQQAGLHPATPAQHAPAARHGRRAQGRRAAAAAAQPQQAAQPARGDSQHARGQRRQPLQLNERHRRAAGSRQHGQQAQRHRQGRHPHRQAQMPTVIENTAVRVQLKPDERPSNRWCRQTRTNSTGRSRSSWAAPRWRSNPGRTPDPG